MAVFTREVRKLDIKKVSERTLTLHLKQKAKKHIIESKDAVNKENNINDQSVKIKNIDLDDTIDKEDIITSLQSKDKVRDKKYLQMKGLCADDKLHKRSKVGNRINSNDFIRSEKVKASNPGIVKTIGSAGVKAASDQVDGGQEIQQAVELMQEASRPVTGTVRKSSKTLGKQLQRSKERNKRKLESGEKTIERSVNKVMQKTTERTVKDSVKYTAKKASKDITKETAKVSSRTAVKYSTSAATTTAGSAGGPAGVLIGMAAGYLAGTAIEAKDMQMSNRSRKISFFLDKMKAKEEQKDTVLKMIKDLFIRMIKFVIKTTAPVIGLVLLSLILIISKITLPVIISVAVLYNSPFAIFLPALEQGETVMSVMYDYVDVFNAEVSELVNNHIGYDEGKIVYTYDEDLYDTPSNYHDILAVYMVRFGVGDMATIMNDTTKSYLQSVFNDMCSYATYAESETRTVIDEDGNEDTLTVTVLCVNIRIKSYREMIKEYGLNSEEVEMLECIISFDYLQRL